MDVGGFLSVAVCAAEDWPPVSDTVEWVKANYPVDPDRVYLSGVSMGGCGALGIGMPRGDVFSAVCVWVPAGGRCRWVLVRDGREVASGIVETGPAGLITIPQVLLTTAPVELRLLAQGQTAGWSNPKCRS